MKKLLYLLILFVIFWRCKSPKQNVEKVILYNDSVGYWNYEWPRERAAFYGFTFKFMKKNKLQKLSFNKVDNTRTTWNDYPYEESIYRWGIADDSIFTFMNYDSKIRILKYKEDTIWLYDSVLKRNSQLIKVKGSLNIEAVKKKVQYIDERTGKEIELLDI